MVGVADQPLVLGIDDEVEQFERDETDQDGASSATSETSMTQSRPWTVSFTGL